MSENESPTGESPVSNNLPVVQTGPKLDDAGRAYLIELIAAGKSNKAVNKALRGKRFLGKNDSLSPQAIHRYRKDPALQHTAAKLNLEALQVGREAMSELVVGWGELSHAALTALLDESGEKIKTVDPKRVTALTNMLAKAHDRLAPLFLPQSGEPLNVEPQTAGTVTNNVTVHVVSFKQLLADYLAGILARLDEDEELKAAEASLRGELPPVDAEFTDLSTGTDDDE